MIKSELIEMIAQRQANLSIENIAESINAVIDMMSDILSKGGRIEIRGFGSFCLHYRPPRKAHNPKTRQHIVTRAKYRPHFKPGKDLRERVNSNGKASENN